MLAASCEGWDKPVAELYADVEKKIPVRRLGQPMDIARAAAFLISDEAGVHQCHLANARRRHDGPPAVVGSPSPTAFNVRCSIFHIKRSTFLIAHLTSKDSARRFLESLVFLDLRI